VEALDSDEPLAGERTDLAWTRSGIAVAVCIAVLLRRVWPLDRTDHQLAVGLVAVGALAWAVALLLARRIARTTHSGREVMGGRALRLISVGTFILALGGFILGWLPPT
jgi:drug/metabolite transporter (DMT)-like permease